MPKEKKSISRKTYSRRIFRHFGSYPGKKNFGVRDEVSFNMLTKWKFSYPSLPPARHSKLSLTSLEQLLV